MHIVTGLLLAKLLKARAKGSGRRSGDSLPSPLLNMPGVITLVHAVPGRCRFRLPALTGRVDAGAKLAARLRDIAGITRADVSAITGSVLIEYDAARLTPDLLAAALVRLLGLERAFAGRVEPALARELRDWARSLNVAVYQKTGGVLDLRTALLLALAVVGVKKLADQRALALPAGFTLLWWAGSGLLRDDGDAA